MPGMDDVLQMWMATYPDSMYLEGRKEFNNIMADFKKRTILRIMKKRYDSGLYLSDLKKIEDAVPRPIKESVLRDWIWLTVNPKPDIQLPNFVEVLAKLVKRKLFCDYYYVIEQRGTVEDDNLGKGFHAHLLLKRSPDKEYKATKRQVQNSFKNFCDTKREAVFYWKECREDFLDDKMEYINSIKTGEGKDLKQKGDIIWRKANGLLPLYSTI